MIGKCWKQVPIQKAKGGLNSNPRRMAVTNWILALPSPSLSYLPPSFPFFLSPSTLSPGSCLPKLLLTQRAEVNTSTCMENASHGVGYQCVVCVCVCVLCHVLTAESDTILDQRKTHHNLRAQYNNNIKKRKIRAWGVCPYWNGPSFLCVNCISPRPLGTTEKYRPALIFPVWHWCAHSPM